MTIKKNNIEDSLFNNVLICYCVLILHVLLIAILGLLVIFFRGIINYMFWICLIGISSFVASGYFTFKRLKKEGKTLKQALSSPLFCGRSVELSILGGLASFKLGKPDDIKTLETAFGSQCKLLEDPKTIQTQELAKLANLLETGLITMDEFDTLKQRIFNAL